MLPVIFWYLIVSLVGLLAFPLAYRFLPALPDRGYAFSRALGLLLWGFTFWLLSSFGFLTNDVGGFLIALALVVGMSLWVLRSVEVDEVLGWLRENRSLVVTIEVLFVNICLQSSQEKLKRNILHTGQGVVLISIGFFSKVLKLSSL